MDTTAGPIPEIPQSYGVVNNGMTYEENVIMYLAASLSRNDFCTDFWMVTYPDGVRIFDDIVVRISFANGETIAVFIKVKYTGIHKNIFINLSQKILRNKYKKNTIEVRLDNLEIMDLRRTASTLVETFKDVPSDKYFYCVFTNSTSVQDVLNMIIQLDDHPTKFMDLSQNNTCLQFAHVENEVYANFLRKFFLFSGQPDLKQLDSKLTSIIGEHFNPKKFSELKRRVNMYQKQMCVPLTKIKFQMRCFEVLLDDFILVDYPKIANIDMRYIKLWEELFSKDQDINVHDLDKIRPLLGFYLQQLVQQKVHNAFSWSDGITAPIEAAINEKYGETVTTIQDLMFLLWEKNYFPLPINPVYTINFQQVRKSYNHLKNRFVTFNHSDTDMSLINTLNGLPSKTALEDIADINLSLQGRPPARLFDIYDIPSAYHRSLILSYITISQLLLWTEDLIDRCHVVGTVITQPVANYIPRRFSIKEFNKTAYRRDNQDSHGQILDESQLKDISDDIIVITGERGMGKTELLRSLAHKCTPSRVVIFVSLSSCNDDFASNRIGSDIIKYFLSKTDPTSDQLITSAFDHLMRNNHSLTFFLDDYDRIIPKYRKNMKSFLETILNRNKIRMFITTTKYVENDLPRARRKMTLDLLPKGFGDNDNPSRSSIEQPLSKQIDLNQRTLDESLVSTSGYVRDVDVLVSNVGDALPSDEDGWTLLHLAAENGRLDIIEGLHTKGININQKTLDGFTAISLASASGYVNIVNFLIENGDDRTLQSNEDGWTPLHFAAENGRLDVIELLHKKGTDINQKTLEGFTAIALASAFGYLNVVTYLIENGSNVSHANEEGWTALHFAAHHGHLDIVELLVAKEVDITQRSLEGCTAMTLACASGYLDVVEFLFTKCPYALHSDFYRCTPLHIAAENGHLNIVELLLEKRVDVNEKTRDGFTAIYLASSRGHLDVVSLLLTKDAHGEDGIHIAAENGHVNILELLSTRVDLNHQDNEGTTAIMKASKYGHVNVVAYLLAKGADPLQSNRYGQNAVNITDIDVKNCNAIIEASASGHLKMVEFILKIGGDPCQSDENGWTPLHWASNGGHLEIVELLLSLKATNVNQETNDGSTATMLASASRHLSIVQNLLDKGSNPLA